MLTRGVQRSAPGGFGRSSARLTTPLAISPRPTSFSLAKMKIASPIAMVLPPYIVFCAAKTKLSALGSPIPALIANGSSAHSHSIVPGGFEV